LKYASFRRDALYISRVTADYQLQQSFLGLNCALEIKQWEWGMRENSCFNVSKHSMTSEEF
jgi:hypothetical protein